jgi:hypothetical protein
VSWRDVLRGALGGMLAGAAGAAQTNGRGGFAQGFGAGAGAELQNETNQKEFQLKQQRVQSDIRFQDAQAADMAARAAQRDHELHLMDQQEHRAEVNAGLENLTRLQSLGLVPTIVVPNNHGGAEAQAGLKQLSDSNGGVPALFTINLGDKVVGFDLNQLSQAPQGLAEVNKNRQVTNPGAPPIDQKMWQQMDPKQRNQMLFNALNFSTPSASPENLLAYQNYLETAKAQPDSPEKAQNVVQLNGIVSRMQGVLDAQTTRQTQQAADLEGKKAEATGVLEKNRAEAEKARAEAKKANQSANPDEDWKSKVTQGQKNKADLADNIAENAATVKAILARRPDLVGVINGRVSQGKELAGTNDPDLTAMDIAIGNLAKANASVHGLRSHEGIKDTEKQILNGFKNGPQGIASALDTTTNSAQTFVDAARPSTSPKHSANGGVRGFYEKQIGQAAASQAPQSHKVGDVITQNGRNFTVTSVDQNGKVTGAK